MLTANWNILKADIKCSILMWCEGHFAFADHILRLTILIPYSISNLLHLEHVLPQRFSRTCMLTCCPSPLFPDTVDVTTTRVSFETKFRMQRSPWPLGAGEMSNFKDVTSVLKRRAKKTVNDNRSAECMVK
jgi:hypothetical protein